MTKPEPDPLHTPQNAPGWPRNDRRPTGFPGEPDPSTTTFDVSEIFAGANQPCIVGGPTSIDLWREQAQADAAERAALLRQIEDGEARQREQNAENLSRYGTTTAPSIPPFGRR